MTVAGIHLRSTSRSGKSTLESWPTLFSPLGGDLLARRLCATLTPTLYTTAGLGHMRVPSGVSRKAKYGLNRHSFFQMYCWISCSMSTIARTRKWNIFVICTIHIIRWAREHSLHKSFLILILYDIEPELIQWAEMQDVKECYHWM